MKAREALSRSVTETASSAEVKGGKHGTTVFGVELIRYKHVSIGVR